VEQIVEFKDASETEKIITEVNPGFMCFNREWLEGNINKLKDNNSQQEYYLTDLVKLAFLGGFSVNTVNIGAHEAMGINSPQELDIAAGLV
jgi:bifunctional UDP-N-acetylglucosamine pyrophosphorylase/glucosamine-1-phosphate N-acetyltransferase